MDLNEKLAARRRELSVEADSVNSSATSVPRADNPVIKDPATENSTKSTSLTGDRSELNRTLTERFTSGLSEPELRNRIGQIFKKLEPEFDPENMIHNIGGMLFLAVTLKRVADREWIVTAEFHEDNKKNKKFGGFVLGALLLYALFSGKMGAAFIIVIALSVVAFLYMKFPDMVTSQTVKACLRNIKNELNSISFSPQGFPDTSDMGDTLHQENAPVQDENKVLTERKKIAVQITKIDGNSNALLAGLEVMDIIETYNGSQISSLQDLHDAVSSVSKPNTTLTVFRRDMLVEFPVRAGCLGIEGSTVLLNDNTHC